MTEAEQTWAYIEKLLHDECGLRLDEGLEQQRANCINAIRNGLPDPTLIAGAIEFLRKGDGLHKIRVNGKMMDRKAIAEALDINTGHLSRFRNQPDNGVIGVVDRAKELDDVKALLKVAIDVFEGMNDDEINCDLLPQLREGLKPTGIIRSNYFRAAVHGGKT